MPKTNGERTWELIKIATILAGIALGYGVLRERVDTNRSQAAAAAALAGDNKMAIIEMRGDVRYIRETVDKIERKLNMQ